MRRVALSFLLFLAAAGVLACRPQPSPVSVPLGNPDFEEGDLGGVPPEWRFPEPCREGGYSAALVEDEAPSGERCAVLRKAGEVQEAVFGNLMQTVPAEPYRGKIIRFRVAVRTEVSGPGNQALLWMRVDRPDQRMGFFDNMNDRPITEGSWRFYEIVGEVAEEAEWINVGMMLIGEGKAWFDDASLEVVGSLPDPSPPRALRGRGLDNLVAFTRLLGYVRYFHPSDEAAEADWEAFAVRGVKEVEGAGSPKKLARTLETLFRPVAPSVRVFPTNRVPADLSGPAPPEDHPEARYLFWRHHGLGTDGRPSLYHSSRIGIEGWGRDRFGNLIQGFAAEPHRGKRVRYRAAARAEVIGDDDAAHLWLRVDCEGGRMGFFDNMAERPITDPEWRVYEIEGEIDPEAARIALGMFLRGAGRAWFDDVTVEVFDGEEVVAALDVVNPGFEEGRIDAPPLGWHFPSQSAGKAFSASLSEEKPGSGSRSGLITGMEVPGPEMPGPGEPLLADLGEGVSCLVPLALYADEEGTLPRVARGPGTEAIGIPGGPYYSGNDRATRLADVALAWNVFQHFYPYFDVVEADWGRSLRDALGSAAMDPDERGFLDTLRHLVAGIHDGHGGVQHDSEVRTHRLPILWEWIEERLVVTFVAEETEGVERGDVVLEIDGRPVEEVAADRRELISTATPQWLHDRLVFDLAVGVADEEVRLVVSGRTGSRREVTLRRSVPLWGDVPLTEPKREKVEEVQPGIWYLDLERITEEDFEGVLPKLWLAGGIVFDMRGYPRHFSPTRVIAHLIEGPVTSARWNVPIVMYPDRKGMEFDFSNWAVEPRELRLRAGIAFLTGGGAISAAETFLGIIEHYELGEIVGGPTAGTNGNVNPFTLPGGYRIMWTGMQVLKHDGSQHHGVGILPTVPVSRTIQGVAEGRDEVLEKGIEVVSRPGG